MKAVGYHTFKTPEYIDKKKYSALSTPEHGLYKKDPLFADRLKFWRISSKSQTQKEMERQFSDRFAGQLLALTKSPDAITSNDLVEAAQDAVKTVQNRFDKVLEEHGETEFPQLITSVYNPLTPLSLN